MKKKAGFVEGSEGDLGKGSRHDGHQGRMFEHLGEQGGPLRSRGWWSWRTEGL